MKKSAKIAFCGVTGASIILLMFLGNIIPIATYAVPCLASMLMMIAMEECGERYAWALFFAICALSFIIIADKELLLIFMLILGYYPMLKKHIEKLRFPAVQAVLKLAAFNLAIAVVYMLLLLVFPISDLISEFHTMGTAIIVALIVLGNITFILFDYALNRVWAVYQKKLRPKLFKSLRG